MFTKKEQILNSRRIEDVEAEGNVINPDDIIKTYGADALRVYLFYGPWSPISRGSTGLRVNSIG